MAKLDLATPNHSKQATWFEHIERWKISGLSQQEYCKEKSLSCHQFGYWRQKYIHCHEPEAASGFIAIESSSSDKRLFLTHPSGWRFDIPKDFTSSELRGLLASLGVISC